MGQSIAVMNTKGGVGKSTLVMALAETLSAYHGKTVLVIDSDSQTSISIMLMARERWEGLEQARRTLVDYLTNVVLAGTSPDWKSFVATGVSDVDDVDSVYLIPSHMELPLLEREISAKDRHAQLRRAIRALLQDAKRYFDVVLIDCPPGLSVLTETWLREADFYLPPTKPDYLAVRGLAVLGNFKDQHSGDGFAENIGVVVNLKDDSIASEEEWHARLAADPTNRVFSTAIPRRTYIQRAADFDPPTRSYAAKYPGDSGLAFRQVTQELLGRLAEARARPQAPTRAEPSRPEEAGSANPSPAATAPAGAPSAPSVRTGAGQAAAPAPASGATGPVLVERASPQRKTGVA